MAVLYLPAASVTDIPDITAIEQLAFRNTLLFKLSPLTTVADHVTHNRYRVVEIGQDG